MTTSDAIESVPRPVPAGVEMTALSRFYRDTRWTGMIAACGMGPGTPPMTAVGGGTHEVIQDGRWIVGTYWQDQFLADGTFVLRWQLHWVTGWDPGHGEYRAVMDMNAAPGHVTIREPQVITGEREGQILLVTFQITVTR